MFFLSEKKNETNRSRNIHRSGLHSSRIDSKIKVERGLDWSNAKVVLCAFTLGDVSNMNSVGGVGDDDMSSLAVSAKERD